MSCKRYKMPCGTLYVNETTVEETFFIEGEPITLKPKQAKFIGGTSNDLVHYLLYPGFWESQKLFEELKAQNKKMNVLVDVSRSPRWGDNLMLTIVPKAYKESYEENVTIDVLVDPAMVPAWENNPHVRSILTEKPTLPYDLTVDLNGMEMKFQPKGTEKCSETILKKAGLHTVNKTPTYKVSDPEKEWAHGLAAGLAHPIIGVGHDSYARIRTYPHMDRLIDLLKEFGGTVIILDEKDEEGGYKYSFREMGAMINECDWVVANDSGVLHLAGALKKRVVGIFGHTDGKVVCENYEHAIPINATKCPIGKHPCWWEVPCVEGATYQVKEPLEPPACLQALEPEEIIDRMCDEIGKIRKVLVVMLTFDLLQWTKIAAESIRSFHDWDLFVADNESTDGTIDWLKEKGIEFEAKRCGVAAAQNIGFRKFLEGDWDYVLLVNNDVALHYNTIDSLVDMMEKNPDLGGLTSKEEMKIAPWTIDQVQPMEKGFELIQDIPTSAYSCTIFRRDIVEKIGLFDEHFTPRYIEDNDYTLRLRIAGAKFAKSKESVFYHAVGAVLGSKEDERKGRNHHWDKNIAYYIEKWGIAPHEPQELTKVGPEHFKGQLVKDIRAHLAKPGAKMPTVRIKCYLAGLGDAIFRSIVARELKRQISDKIRVIYTVSFDPKEDQSDKSRERQAILRTYPYIDKVEPRPLEAADFSLDLTETEFREEWQEVSREGRIDSARTEIYLKIAGLECDQLKPDYFVLPSEAELATKYWNAHPGKKRIVMAKEGSNKLKCWHGMDELEHRLVAEGYAVVHPVKEDMDFRHLGAVIAQADLVISPDSGPSNLAGALGVPALTLFSNRNGANFAKMFPSMIDIQGTCPYHTCNYCDYKMTCSKTEGPYRIKENGLGEPECFQALTVDRVFTIAKEMLGC